MKAIVVYILFFISAIIALLELIFFILFLISFNHHKKLDSTAQYSINSKKWPNHVKEIITLEFFMFLFGIGQFVLYFFAFKSRYHLILFLLSLISLLCFICFWIGTIIIFSTSPEYKFIKSIDQDGLNSNLKLYSWDSFNEQMNKWSEQNPILHFQAVGSTEDMICTGNINISTTKNMDHSYNSEDINFGNIVGDSIVLIDIDVDINWNFEYEMKIKKLQSDIKKCTKKTLEATNVSKVDEIKKLPKAILMTKNGKIPKKLKRSSAITRAFFGLGFDVITDLTSIPIYKRTIEIIYPEFDYNFDCSKFNYHCFTLPNITKNNRVIHHSKPKKSIFFQKLKSKIIQMFSKKSTSSIDRYRLTRSFYLSKCAYEYQFKYFINEEKNEYPEYFVGNLISIIHYNLNNGLFNPVWYVGTSGKNLYVIIRGTDSLFDWVTDIPIYTVVKTDDSYHSGFYYAACNIFQQIKDTVNNHVNKGYTIVFTGHSLGGSVAQILHHLFSKYINNDKLCSYVFGAAASMGKTPAKDIKSNCFSFVYCNDIVPRAMHYVTFLKKKGYLPDIIQKIFGDYESQIYVSSDWNPTNFEDIDDPVGTIYYLPYEFFSTKHLKQISSAIIQITDSFYQYDAISIVNAIPDHSLCRYYENLFYKDGIYFPGEI